MNEQDIELYHYMLNIELKQFMSQQHLINRNENRFSDFVIKEFKRLKRDKKISLSNFKYFHDAFLPNRKGFKNRWDKRLERYNEIYSKNSQLQGKNAEQRLQAFFNELSRYQFIIKSPHDDEIEFNESDSPKVLALGFLGIHKEQLNKIKEDQNEAILTYYIGDSGIKAETMLIYHLQNYGFNIALELNRSQQRLAHHTFSHLHIESFYEKLSFCQQEPSYVEA
ncbi:hypothetical protein M6B40_000005 [Vibrio metschnikovii]|nr:hypothetical protein [Vibrio metschnikovii]EKO3597890.1 hypothetical protein [Vibrio metschnikovii]EKO3709754.1 hypothetical protein [Vibrio metschnikovii]EKO3730367.1 hypothetical protein [Vibrio metschnikovii]